MAVFDIDKTILDSSQRFKDAQRAGLVDKDGNAVKKSKVETMGKAMKRRNDFLYSPDNMRKDKVINGALALIDDLVKKGYTIAYLTARPFSFHTETINQLEDKGFPIFRDNQDVMLVISKGKLGQSTPNYKAEKLLELSAKYDVRMFFDDDKDILSAVGSHPMLDIPGLYLSIRDYRQYSSKSNPVIDSYAKEYAYEEPTLSNPPVKPRRKKMSNGKYRKEPAKKYVDRFMSDSKMTQEFPDNGQRYAVCLTYVEKFYGKSGLDSVGARRNPEEYQEDYMVPRDIHRLGKAADSLESTYEESQEVPEWWKSKLSVTAKDADTLADALQYVDERESSDRSSLPFRPTSDCFLTYKGKLVAKDMGHYIAFPGGGVDPEETPLDAATREVMEETGAILKGPMTSLGEITWVWNPEWADNEKRKKRYEQFQGERVYFFTGEVEKFVKPTSDEGDAWSGKKLMKFSDAIAYLQAEKANLKHPNQAKYIDYQIACLSQIQKAKGKMTGAQYRAGIKKMLEARANPGEDALTVFTGEPNGQFANKGMVTAEVQIGRGIMKDIGEGIQDIYRGIIGGRQSMTEKRMAMAVATMHKELSDRAKAKGANAVANLQIDYEYPTQGDLTLMATADAIKMSSPPKQNPLPLMGLSVQVSGYRNAAGAFVMKGKKFLILQRSTKETSKHGLWELPGGKVEKGETPRETAVIEVKEEAGLDIKLKANLGPHHDDKMKKTYHAYVAVPKKGQRVKLSEEHSDYKWLTPEEVMAMPNKMVSHHLRYFLKKESETIRNNPANPSKVEKGKKLYKHMNGKDPEKIETKKIDMGDVWYQVGEGGCWQIGYMSGKETGSSSQKYTHTFNEETKDGNFPKLYATMPENGKPMLIITGGTWKIKTDDTGTAWIYD